MKNRFQFLSYSGFYIETGKKYKIMIDPFLDNNPDVSLSSADFDGINLVIATHGAYDHVGDTAKIAIRCNSWIICPDDVKTQMISEGVPEKQIICVPWGMTVDFGFGIKVKPIENHHRSHVTLPDGRDFSSQPLAFILYLEDGTRVYIAGDTAIFSDMKLQGELYRPHIGLINAVTDQIEKENPEGRPTIIMGEMSPFEAALCSKWLMLDTVIPCHHIRSSNPQLKEFIDIMEQMNKTEGSYTNVVKMDAGDIFEYSALKETK